MHFQIGICEEMGLIKKNLAAEMKKSKKKKGDNALLYTAHCIQSKWHS